MRFIAALLLAASLSVAAQTAPPVPMQAQGIQVKDMTYAQLKKETKLELKIFKKMQKIDYERMKLQAKANLLQKQVEEMKKKP